MNPSMYRSKLLAALVALVASGAAALLLAGGASAASWHVYEGDVYAGHAYGLQVPAGAEAIEFALDGAEGATAQLAVYAPAGERVGVYTLSSALRAASVANPEKGQYVVYVYELGDAALTVRVSSDDAPALKLDEVPLVREEVRIGSFPNGPLDQVITTDLKRVPVFVTLLYEGSAKGLDATVASEKGAVVTVTDETATAFSAGVWTSMKGERAFDASNLQGTTYTTEVHAERFEGTMVLTTLALDVRAPAVPAPAVPARPAKPGVPAAGPVAPDAGVFALEAGVPVAFTAEAGLLLLADPEAVDPAAEKEDEEKDHHRHGRREVAVLSLYAPDDSLLAHIELDEDAQTAEVELPVAGEYVAYVRHASNEVVLAKLLGARIAPELRQLEVVTETFEANETDLLLVHQPRAVTFARAPLDLEMEFDDGFGAVATATLTDAEGETVAEAHSLVEAGFSFTSYTWVDYARLAAGEHSLRIDGLYEGGLTLVVSHFVRESEVVAEEKAHAEHEGHAPPVPPAPPAPPAVPAAAPGVAALAAALL